MGMFLPASQYVQLPHNDSPWLIEGLLAEEGMLLVFGSPKTGKSLLALTMVVGLLNGWDEIAGCKVITRPQRIAYLQVDTPRPEQIQRVLAVQAAGYSMEGAFFTDAKLAPYPFNITAVGPQGTAAILKHDLEEWDPDLIVVDTYRNIHFGNENDSGDTHRTVSALRDATGHKTLILVSHAKKVSEAAAMMEADVIEDVRGSSALAGAVDTICKMSMKKDTRTGRLEVVGRGCPLLKQPIYMQQEAPFLIFPEESKADQQVGDARKLVLANKGMSQRELGRLVADKLHLSEATARRRVVTILKEGVTI